MTTLLLSAKSAKRYSDSTTIETETGDSSHAGLFANCRIAGECGPHACSWRRGRLFVRNVRRWRRVPHDTHAHFCRCAERRCCCNRSQSADRLVYYGHDRAIPAQECRHQARYVSPDRWRGGSTARGSDYQVSEANRSGRTVCRPPLRRVHELCWRHDARRELARAEQSAQRPAHSRGADPLTTTGFTACPSRHASRRRSFISARFPPWRLERSSGSCPVSWAWAAALSWSRS